MALSGTGKECDISYLAGSSLKTTTSQYRVCGVEDTSTSADFTAYLTGAGSTPASTITSRSAIGINQTHLSATANECAVRVLGISKAVCAASIAAGAFIVAYEGASTTTRAGQIVAVTESVFPTSVVLSMTSLAVARQVVLGRAMEDGSTNTVISVLLNPQLYSQISGT
jgi:hypothetical protein